MELAGRWQSELAGFAPKSHIAAGAAGERLLNGAKFYSVGEASYYGVYGGDPAMVAAALQRRAAAVDAIGRLMRDDPEPFVDLIGDNWSGWYEAAQEMKEAHYWREEQFPNAQIATAGTKGNDFTAAQKRQMWADSRGVDALTGLALHKQDDVYEALYRHRDQLPPLVEREVKYKNDTVVQLYGFKPIRMPNGTCRLAIQTRAGAQRSEPPAPAKSSMLIGPLNYVLANYDHVHPKSRGGQAHIGNAMLVSAFENTVKRNVLLTELDVAVPPPVTR